MPRNLLFSLALLFLVSACGTPAPKLPTKAEPAPAAPMRPERAEALLQALLALGLDYRNGGSSHENGFDCSGLVVHVYREAWGIELPRETRDQSRVGVPVSLAELQAGDLVFYNTLDRPFSHVGIYLGDGRFVHAPKTGARVRVESVWAAYWTQRFNGARRVEPPL
jgi:cell wall-associated NlpC family hydrolase